MPHRNRFNLTRQEWQPAKANRFTNRWSIGLSVAVLVSAGGLVATPATALTTATTDTVVTSVDFEDGTTGT